ncbi:MAG: alpha/beta hydrolase [Chrysiogenales bacterium]|nr:MAG: alpha/beta hydrolase [Chrysiogenales bacterium]
MDLIKSKIEHKVLEKEGYAIHYFISGDKSKETIVFLHPAFADHRCFDKQIDLFSKNYQVVTVDLLGHGLSQVGKAKVKIDSSAEHIEEIFKSAGIKSAHLVGVSMGSLIAQCFALKYPERILSLTVLGGYSINKENKELAKAQRKEIFKWLFKMIFSMDAFRKYVASVSLIDKVEQVRFLESASLFTRKSFIVMSGLGNIIKQRENVQQTYPLLILAGEKDLALVLKTSAEWHKEAQGSRFYVIEKAGHCANMDNSAKFNEVLLNFIQFG